MNNTLTTISRHQVAQSLAKSQILQQASTAMLERVHADAIQDSQFV